MPVVNGYCTECGNREESLTVTCPSCGREPKKLNLHALSDFEAGRLVARAKTLGVPEQYLANVWSEEKFWRNHLEYQNPDTGKYQPLDYYVKQLTGVFNIFANGRIPGQSGLIISPATYGKSTWAFSCMQMALKHGFTVAPLLTTLEAQRVLVMGAHKPDFKLDKQVTFEEYIYADVLFLSVSKLEYYKQAYAVIREIADMRSNKGLGYFILSEKTVEEMCEWESGSRQFLKMFKEGPYENNLKYPVKIQFSEGIS